MAKMPTTPTSTAAGGGGLAAGVSISSRIPATLQSVFLASNRGQTVHKPPPAKVASKTYFRNWLFQGVSAGSGRNNSNSSNNNNAIKTSSSSNASSQQRGVSGLFSLKSTFARSSTSTAASTTTTATTLPSSSSGTRSPPRTTNGSKYKIGTVCSKKQTDALVHAAAERLQLAQQQRDEQKQPQQSLSSGVKVSEPSAASTTANAAASSPSNALDFRTAARAAAASAVTDGDSETESNSSSSTTDVSVSATANNTTPSSSQAASLESPLVTVSPPRLSERAVVSPQDYLDNLLQSRGYSTRRFATLQTAYYNKSTALQMASYHVHLINLAKSGEEIHSFAALLSSGLSPNPANAHGESLLHTVCRRGLHTVLKTMLEQCHSCVAVADDYGRTLLHDAMWNNTPSLPTISLLLKHGDACALFFLEDARGALPLQYARPEHWPVWLSYLQHVQDEHWPVRRTKEEEGVKEPSPLLLAPPGSHPLVDPVHALPLDVALLVASGKLSPTEAVFLVDDEQDDESDSESNDESDDESGNDDDDMSHEEGSSCDDDDSDNDDSDDDDSSWDEEMEDMLKLLPAIAAAKGMS